jgi:ankyrin repeat protein
MDDNLFHTDINIINKKLYSDLELNTIVNNYNLIKTNLDNNETVYYPDSKNRIYGWRYYMKYKQEPKKHILKEGYLTCVKLSLIKNYQIYKSLYKNLIELKKYEMVLETYNNDQISELYAQMINSLNTIIDYFIKLDDIDIYKLKEQYDETEYKFNEINKLLIKNLPSIRYFFEELLIGDIRENNIKLEEYKTSIHYYTKKLLEPKIEISNIKTQIKENGRQILKLDEIYFENVKIVLLLLNQQNYEIFKIFLKSYPSDNNLLEWIKTNSNSYINFNYKDTYLHLIATHGNYPKSINYMIRNKWTVKTECAQIALEKKNYKSAHILIRSNETKQNKIVNGKFITDLIFDDKFISDQERYKFIKEILDKNINYKLTNTNIDNLTKIINYDNSLDIIKLLINKNKLKPDDITLSTINKCLKLEKIETLEILYPYISLKDQEQIPFIFFEQTKNDTTKNIKLLKLILKNCDINYTDKNKESIIFKAIKNKRIDSIKLLIDKKADLFIRNIKNQNTLIYSISQNNHEAIKLLIDQKSNNKNLINMTNKKKNVFILSLDSKEPIKIIKILLKDKRSRTSINKLDREGKNIYSYLINKYKTDQITKKIILNLILPIAKLNNRTNKPILIQAQEQNDYIFVYEIVLFLLKSEQIYIETLENINGFDQLLKSNRPIIVKLNKNQNEINYYSSIMLYLRQNILRFEKMNNFLSIFLLSILNSVYKIMLKYEIKQKNHNIFNIT